MRKTEKIKLKFQKFVNRNFFRTFVSAKYYQRLHDLSKSYQTGCNWLLDQDVLLNQLSDLTIVEIGCGNGKFLMKAAESAHRVYGLDWAISPEIDKLPDNVQVCQTNVLESPLPFSDLVCSGDVLEHFSEKDLGYLLLEMKRAAPRQYHVIACYDDNHSHLTIKPPEWWKEKFEHVFDQTFSCETKVNAKGKVVATLHNLKIQRQGDNFKSAKAIHGSQ